MHRTKIMHGWFLVAQVNLKEVLYEPNPIPRKRTQSHQIPPSQINRRWDKKWNESGEGCKTEFNGNKLTHPDQCQSLKFLTPYLAETRPDFKLHQLSVGMEIFQEFFY